jgi:hypothetical protein
VLREYASIGGATAFDRVGGTATGFPQALQNEAPSGLDAPQGLQNIVFPNPGQMRVG